MSEEALKIAMKRRDKKKKKRRDRKAFSRINAKK